MRKNNVIAVLVADVHLSEKKPLIWSDSVSWLGAQARYLDELSEACLRFDAPLICGGDLFDKWNSRACVINLALTHLPPRVYSVYGQHDLENHSRIDLSNTAYGVLVESKRIEDISKGRTVELANGWLTVRGFGWEEEIEPIPLGYYEGVALCVSHQYVWQPGRKFPTASAKARISKKNFAALRAYTAVLFGDNHRGFQTELGKLSVLNNGGMIRRRIDELDEVPSFGLLHMDGTIQRVPFEAAKEDKFSDIRKAEEAEKTQIDYFNFIQRLSEVEESELDFKAAVVEFAREQKSPKKIIELLQEIIE